MMKTSVIGYPRIGEKRELKFAEEKYFSGIASTEELLSVSAALRKKRWETQAEAGIDFIPSNDFSLYDNLLDAAVCLNVIPIRYKALRLDPLGEYFAMARGYQGPNGDVRALAMKKWFNTNYHFIAPEICDDMKISLVYSKPLDEYREAKRLGIETKPVLIGPFTFLRLAKFTGAKRAEDFADDMAEAYSGLLSALSSAGAAWVQFDEPFAVTDLSEGDIALFCALYGGILKKKRNVRVVLQTYFGDVRDCYQQLAALPFDGIGLDFIEGKKNAELIEKYGFPDGKTLFAGVVNGKNIRRNNYAATLSLICELQKHACDIVLSTSCSLLHVPYSLDYESKLSPEDKKHFAFAREKLAELKTLQKLSDMHSPERSTDHSENAALFAGRKTAADPSVSKAISSLAPIDFVRRPAFAEREKLQKKALGLPLLPTTTIGSFPQTADVKENRARLKKGEISGEEYDAFNKNKIAECIALQERLGLDVLVHGEFERNDMVEYFGEKLNGFLFTENGWVQSYGTRCVKPPIIFGDVSRTGPMSVEYIKYAQSLTKKYVKGMLTGPVTILNWSFPREDIPLSESAFQIALAIRAEVLDLEANGIRIIQIDEAALREKLPLRKSDWHKDYLDWAIPAFRLVHSGVKPETQIHTHMCYSEFLDIIGDIDDMDADVITFEASRSDMEILGALKRSGFKTEVGPGVYDIHSPRVPDKDEIRGAILRMLDNIPIDKLWVNPDCGLKTRGSDETVRSLENMVAAAQEIREGL